MCVCVYIYIFCLIYISDAADATLCIDLGSRCYIKKKKPQHTKLLLIL